MRIIAGSRKGSKLFAPKGENTRPTEDRIKENIFNIIDHNLYGLKVLDLFSGTGSIGLEFISRGAEEAYLFEKNASAFDIIKKNIDKLGFEKEAKLFKGDSLKLLKNLENIKFDYVYIDPPYKRVDLYKKSIDYLVNSDLIDKNSYIITEEDKVYLQDYTDMLNLIKEKKYRDTYIRIWRMKWK